MKSAAPLAVVQRFVNEKFGVVRQLHRQRVVWAAVHIGVIGVAWTMILCFNCTSRKVSQGQHLLLIYNSAYRCSMLFAWIRRSSGLAVRRSDQMEVHDVAWTVSSSCQRPWETHDPHYQEAPPAPWSSPCLQSSCSAYWPRPMSVGSSGVGSLIPKESLASLDARSEADSATLNGGGPDGSQ